MIRGEEFLKLEKKWFNYKKRFILRFFFILVFIFFLIALLFYLILFDRNLENDISYSNNTSTANIDYRNEYKIITQNETVAENINYSIENNYSKNDTIKTSDQNNLGVQNNRSEIKVNNNSIVANKNNVTNINNNKNQSNIPIPVENKILIQTQNINNIQILMDRFNETRNVIFANMISQEYYDQKNYINARKWAVEANEIDPKNEESWILFAKSSVKIGKKDEAIHALNVYLKYSPKSNNIISLLKSIQDNSFH